MANKGEKLRTLGYLPRSEERKNCHHYVHTKLRRGLQQGKDKTTTAIQMLKKKINSIEIEN